MRSKGLGVRSEHLWVTSERKGVRSKRQKYGINVSCFSVTFKPSPGGHENVDNKPPCVERPKRRRDEEKKIREKQGGPGAPAYKQARTEIRHFATTLRTFAFLAALPTVKSENFKG